MCVFPGKKKKKRKKNGTHNIENLSDLEPSGNEVFYKAAASCVAERLQSF